MDTFKMKILASVSHKLKTPINCSLNMLQSMVERADSIDLTILRDLVEPALCSNLLLTSYINDVCDYAAIETGTFSCDISRFSITILLADCIRIF